MMKLSTSKLSTSKLSTSKITNLRNFGMYLSIVLVLFSLFGIFKQGLNLGIDFSGGLISEFQTSQSIEKPQMQQMLQSKIETVFVLNSARDNTHWTVRQADTGQTLASSQWLQQLSEQLAQQQPPVQLEKLDSDYIDSQVGQELVDQGGMALITALIMILLYLSARFEWRFATGAILALFHDVIVVLGLFAWLQLEFNLTVLASLLAIIGYSLNDSIIVADRIRELMRTTKLTSMNSVIDSAIKSTITRTLITSGTTLTTVAAIWWLAGKPLEGFSIALFTGIVFGTLSSICIAPSVPALLGLEVNYYANKQAQLEAILESE